MKLISAALLLVLSLSAFAQDDSHRGDDRYDNISVTGDTICGYHFYYADMDSAFLAKSTQVTVGPKLVTVICSKGYNEQGLYLRDEKTKDYFAFYDNYEVGSQYISLDTAYLKNVTSNVNTDLIIQYRLEGGGISISEQITYLAVVDYIHMKLLFNKPIAEEDEYHGANDPDSINGTYSIFKLKAAFKPGEIDLSDTDCNGCAVRHEEVYLLKGGCFIKKK